MSAPEESSGQQQLIVALQEQTQAINALAQSNRELVAVIADLLAEDVEQDPDAQPSTYMDGSPRR